MNLMLRENIRQALNSIRGNLLRASLTMLIIAFGIMAIVGVLTSIDGIKYYLSNSFSSLGSNTFKIQNRVSAIRIGGPGSNQRRYPSITLDETDEFRSRVKEDLTIAVNAMGTGATDARFRNLSTNKNIAVMGVDENYTVTEGYKIEEGRALTEDDIRNGRNTVVIGYELKTKLFPTSSPIGQWVTVGKHQYKIVGLIESKGSGFGPGSGDKIALIPYPTMLRHYPNPNRSFTISVFVAEPTRMPGIAAECEGIFRIVRKLKPADEINFGVNMSDSLVSQLMDNLRVLTLSATAIAIITLFGASIGLMNIMLVSVTERTREIGVRKSLGASKQHIMLQFLIEAITICQLGGIIGIGLGILIGNVISLLLGSGFIIPWLWMFMAFMVCFVVGIASGFYPARRAANLDPIESLRYE